VLNPVGPNLFGLHAVIEGPVVTKRGWSNEFDPTVGVAGINRGVKNVFCARPARARLQETLNPVGPNLFGLHAVIEGPVVTQRGWSNEFDPTVGVAGIIRGVKYLFFACLVREQPSGALNVPGV